jgi:hypothetical protein
VFKTQLFIAILGILFKSQFDNITAAVKPAAAGIHRAAI